MRISNYFGISLYKFPHVSLILYTLATEGWTSVDNIKQEEKINKYLDLAVEIKELWKMKSAKVVPVVI